jgi:hypothetical protein
LLLAVAPEGLTAVQACLKNAGWGDFLQPIGRMIDKEEKTIQVLNR